MEELLTALAHDLAAGSQGSEITFTGSFSVSGMSMRTVPPSFHFPDDELCQRLGALFEGAGSVVQVRIESDGSFDAVLTRGIIQAGGDQAPAYSLLLEPRPRQLPRPPQSGEPLPPNGDPALIPELADRCADLYERKHGERPEPVTAEGLDSDLPADVQALYQHGIGRLGEAYLVPPDQISKTLQGILEVEEWSMDDPTEWERPTLYHGPEGAVRLTDSNPRWIPIGDRGQSTYLVIDLDPGPNGRYGQVIEVSCGQYPLRYLAPSVTAYLQDVLLQREEEEPPPTKDAVSVAKQGLAVAPTVQDLVLWEVGDIDLSPLADLPLRELRVLSDGHVRIGDLTRCPLERLEISAKEVDLAPLAGHPTLRALTVEGGASVTLPHLPVLRILDVANAVVDVATLPTVEYLTLHKDQWPACDQRPAAVSLLGEPTLAGALDWADRFVPPLTRVRVQGRV